jgi:hypothetical protein
MIWITIAIVGWTMIAWLAFQLFATRPPTAGFDLELLLRAGRDVAAGRSPYEPALVAGTAPGATGLFFSYPPVVAQVLALFAAIPSGAMFVAWSIAAVAALVAVTERLRVAIAASVPPAAAATAVVAVSSLTFPLVVAILFGNLDAFFPALYGLALVGAVSSRRGDQVAGGIGIAIGALTKLYPAGLGLWFAIRAVRGMQAHRVVLLSAVLSAMAVIAVSLILGGVEPWRSFASVVSTTSRAELIDTRNVAPAAQLALLVGADSAFARSVHLGVAGLAIIAILWAAWAIRDDVESLAIAAAATLLLLPIAWIHYPAALIPFGAAAAMRSRGASNGTRVGWLLAAAVAVAGASLAWLPLMWLAVGLCLAAVHLSAPRANSQPRAAAA